MMMYWYKKYGYTVAYCPYMDGAWTLEGGKLQAISLTAASQPTIFNTGPHGTCQDHTFSHIKTQKGILHVFLFCEQGRYSMLANIRKCKSWAKLKG